MKKFLRAITIIVLCIGVLYIAARMVVKHKITSALDQQVKAGNLTYAAVHLNLLHGNVSVDSLTYRFQENQIFTKKIAVDGFGYYAYLFKKQWQADKISVAGPNVIMVKQKKTDSLPHKKQAQPHLQKTIRVADISVHHGNFLLKNDSLNLLQVNDYDLHLNEVEATPESLKKKIPFTYNSYHIKSGALNYHINEIQNIEVDSLDIKTHSAVLNHIHLIPNYSKKDYVKVIPFEKDLMDMTMKSLHIPDYTLDLSTPHGKFSAPMVKLDSIDLNIFRDKRVKDDPRKKKLYSRMLRELPLKLNIDSLKMRRTNIDYKELQKSTGKTGEVFFKNMKIDATSITNIDLQRQDFPKTEVNISSDFMGTSPLHVKWGFTVNKPNDNFRIRGQGAHIPPKAMNNFFKPAFNMKAKGNGIEHLYFDFYGNSEIAQGQLKMVYKNLKIEVLKKNGHDRNGFLSFVANIFVSKQSDKNDDPVEVSHVKRDKTKSFWNYFWKCVFAGLKKTLL